MWAKNSSGNYALQNQVFNIYQRKFDPVEAFFTSTLAQPMPAGNYTYYICYPVPQKVNGRQATFEIPSRQDGKASGGVDITVSSATNYTELKASSTEGKDIDPIPAELHHLLHFLRFYIPQGTNLLGEPIRTIVIRMPGPVAGTLTVDVTSPSSAVLSNGRNTITLDLAEPLQESNSENRYAVAGIFPPSTPYGLEDFLKIELYSENKMADISPVSLAGRSFAAGHVTGVKLKPVQVRAYFDLSFRLTGNNLGQDVQKVTLTLPEGTIWPGTNSNVYVYQGENGTGMVPGQDILIRTDNGDAYRALSGKSVTISYESEDAIVSQNITIPNIGSATKKSVDIAVPYLFYEDFSGLAADFHSYDEHATSNPESRDGIEFLPGWSGARVGGMAHTSIRTGAHRESVACYAARCDSPFMTGLKHTVTEFQSAGKTIALRVQYNYSMGREEGGIGRAKVGMYIQFGYSTKTGTIESEDKHGTFGEEEYMKVLTGTFTNIEYSADKTLAQMGKDRRITWRTICEENYGPNNSTCYFYLDNIKVSIISNK